MFCVIITVSQSKGSSVFCQLELHVRKKTLLKIWLNPGLNFRGTGLSCYLVLSFILVFGSEKYNVEH